MKDEGHWVAQLKSPQRGVGGLSLRCTGDDRRLPNEIPGRSELGENPSACANGIYS